MKVFIVVVSVFIAVLAAPTSVEEETHQDPATSLRDIPIHEPSEPDVEGVEDLPPNPVQEDENSEINRKKKSATTTFCVEVKPNNPYQKPYELCESGNDIYAVPAAPAPAPAPIATAYGPPQKTYTPIASSSGYIQAAPVHSAGYKASSKPYESKKYRANVDDMKKDNSEEEKAVHDNMRSAYGYGGDYGGYGSGLIKYIAEEDKKYKKKGHGHSGVVITCQPNLAGYASPAHPGGYGGYGGGYRNSNQEDNTHSQMKSMEESRLGKSYDYGHRTDGMSTYGSYGYGMAPSHPAPYGGPSYPSRSSPYSAPTPSFPPASAPSYPAPSPSYPAAPLSYSPPAPSYSMPAHPAPAAYNAPENHVPASYYAASGYGSSYKPHKVISSYPAPLYSPPGTYRNNEGEDNMEAMDMDGKDKEARTMETMKKMAEEKTSQWSHDMTNNKDQQKKTSTMEIPKKMQ